MLLFKQWLETRDDEWSMDDILLSIKSGHDGIDLSNTQVMPSGIDPDFFLKKGGLFTFAYNKRGLILGSPRLTHRSIMPRTDQVLPEYNMTGRYGIANGYPIVTTWISKKYLLIPCLKELWDRKLIHPESLYYEDYENKGFVKDVANIRINKKHQWITISNKQYDMYVIPALLHTLPAASPELQSIKNFICQQKDYQFLLQFKSRAGCKSSLPFVSTKPTEYERRNLTTSEQSR